MLIWRNSNNFQIFINLYTACLSTKIHAVSPEPSLSHTRSMEVDEGSDQKVDFQPNWTTAHARLKNEFTEDKRCQNLVSRLILVYVAVYRL